LGLRKFQLTRGNKLYVGADRADGIVTTEPNSIL